MKTYQLIVYRDARWWMVSVPELDALTQAHNLHEAEFMGRDLISLVLEVPADSFDIEMTITSVGAVDKISEQVAQIAQSRATAAEIEHQASVAAITLAKRLKAEDVTIRDIGEILGVSHQRAHQLLNS
jgi:hypothetical protein